MCIDEFKISTEKARRNQSATKILNELNTQRKSMNPLTARRWVWELMQNAKDVAYDNQEIKISINHSNGELDFKHNGRYFSVDNVISLIEQVSSKERDEEVRKEKQVTGKFGTGFLSTHLLSEVVVVDGVVELSERGLNKFSIVLDRTGKTIEEINNGIDQCHKELKKTYSPGNNIGELDQKAYNTVFKYHLNDNGEVTAQEGLEELHRSAIFTLAFVPAIKSIQVESSEITYSVEDQVIHLKDNIKKVKIKKCVQGNIETCYVIVANEDETSVGIEVECINDEYYVKELNEKTPRIFCDFPLIGTEKFSFPAVINNAFLDLNEPRDDIFLSTSDNEDVLKNKAILETAVELFNDIVKLSVEKNWKKQYIFAQVPELIDKKGFDKEWFEEKIINPIKETLLHNPIIETATGERKSIKSRDNKVMVWFPSNAKEDFRMSIWELMHKFKSYHLPKKDEIDIWYNIKWIDCGKLTLKTMISSVRNLENLNRLESDLREGLNPIVWMNEFFTLILSDKTILNEVANNEHQIIPNQYGIFEKKKFICLDKSIHSIFKEILKSFDVDIRSKLKHNNIKIGTIELNPSTQDSVVDELNKKLENTRIFANQKNAACDQLIAICPMVNVSDFQSELIRYSKELFKESTIEVVSIDSWKNEIIEVAAEYQLLRMIRKISLLDNLNNFSLYMNHDNIEDTKIWFHSFIDFLIKADKRNMLDNNKYPILPDQNGMFCCESEVFEDDGEIDEELKDICNSFGTDFREHLLINEISLELPEGRIKNEKELAEEIFRRVNMIKDIRPRDDKTKNAFKDLLLWFYDNEEKTGNLFSIIHENIYWLYDDKEIAENIKRSKEITTVMDELGIDDIQELRERLIAQSSKNANVTKEVLTNEVLASLGITTVEEYALLLKDQNFGEKYHHTSTPDFEMLKYSKKINKRSMEKVIEYLNRHPDYICEELELHAPTIIGGIYKKEISEPIHVVVRPSDDGKVLIYNPSEKEILECSTSELWIQKGDEIPSHLTLGKILKVTGINKIPIK